jgi:hypothetical protein
MPLTLDLFNKVQYELDMLGDSLPKHTFFFGIRIESTRVHKKERRKLECACAELRKRSCSVVKCFNEIY